LPASEGTGNLSLTYLNTRFNPSERDSEASAMPPLDGASIEAAAGTATRYDAWASDAGRPPAIKKETADASSLPA